VDAKESGAGKQAEPNRETKGITTFDNISELINSVRSNRYTGTLILHYNNGQVSKIERFQEVVLLNE